MKAAIAGGLAGNDSAGGEQFYCVSLALFILLLLLFFSDFISLFFFLSFLLSCPYLNP